MSLDVYLEQTVRRAVEQAVAPLQQELAALREQLAARAAPAAEDARLTVRQAAEVAGLSQDTIRAMLASGKLTRYGTPHAIRVSKRQLLSVRADVDQQKVVDLEEAARARAAAILAGPAAGRR